MWSDNETDIDFLNFSSVADVVAETIVQSDGAPISIGVSGAWGVGKSSMIKLVRKGLERRGEEKFLFVEFNAWLYQGYDDVRAALLEVIAKAIEARAKKDQKGVDKAMELLKRVNWLRVGKLTAGTTASLLLGLPPVGLIGEVINLGKSVIAGSVDQAAIKQMEKTGSEIVKEAAGILKDRKDSSPPEEIHAIRAAFEQSLEDLGITLIVLIDDLDRCLPETTIAALEAIRLFLFLRHTAFVIAADNGLIKHAVRRHFDFGEVDHSYVTNYFDKLIQVPISVPPLGTQEVRAYLMLLFLHASSLPIESQATVRERVCKQLARTWKGERVDRAFMNSLGIPFDADTIARFDNAERLAPLMTTATDIKGNPRLIKRFLNALSIRMSISRSHDIGVDEAVLAKLLLFERCGNPAAYARLVEAVNLSPEGKPAFLGEWENKAVSREELKLDKPWSEEFVKEWLSLHPPLADRDLRGALYVSREHAPLVTPGDRLSSKGAELLKALLEHPEMATEVKEDLTSLHRAELAIIFDHLLERAGQNQEWGVPDILQACMVVARVDPNLGSRLAGFLIERPVGQITPAIVPKIASEPWADAVIEKWKKSGVSKAVLKAMEKHHGHI